MLSTSRLTKDVITAIEDPSLYRFYGWSLKYLLITHPELAHNVNRVCQFMHNPQHHHWKIVKRILRYLAGTSTHGLQLFRSSHLSLNAFADAN